MVYYNNEIGVLPQETKEYKQNTREDEQYPSEQNEMSEKALKKQFKKPKITTEQFQHHLNADPKLKAAYAEHQVLMDRQKQANERVKNTGYLGTLWGGITGDSGVDDLAKINENMNSANTKFRNALDQNSGLSHELKQQLIGYKLGADSGLNAATAQAAGGFSERAENYAGTTKAVRNTAIGAGLGVSAVLTGGATLGAASALAAGEGGVLLAGGTLAGGALTGSLGNTGYSLLRDEVGVALESGLNKKDLGQVQNQKNDQILTNAVQANKDGAKFGTALPLAVTPAGQVIFAGVGSYAGAKSTVEAGKNISTAYDLSKQESEARKSGNTALAEQFKTQKNVHVTEGVLSAGDTAAVLGVGNRINKKLQGTNSTEIPSSTRQENSRKNPGKPVEGIEIPEGRQIFSRVASSPSSQSSEPRSPHDTHMTTVLQDGTKIIQGNNMANRGPFQNSRIEISPDGSYKYTSSQNVPAGKQGESQTRIVNKQPQIVPESGDHRPLTFYDQRGYGKSGLEPKITRKEGFDPDSTMNFKTVEQVQGLSSKAKLTSFSRPGEKPIMPPKDLQSALRVDFPKDRKFYKERAQKQREEAQNDHPKKASVPQNLPRQDIDVTWNQDGTRTVQTGGFDRKNNYRIMSNDYPIDSMHTRSGSIIKGMPEGSSVLSYKIGVDGKKAKGYSYEKKGPDGTIQAARVNDGRGNGISEVLKPDKSSNIRTYQRTPMGTLSTFDGGNNQRVSTTSKDGNKITYGFEQSSIPGTPGKAYQTIRRSDGTVSKGEAQISGDNSKRILYTPPKGSSELPDHLKTVTKPEQVPQKPSTPPENLKNVTLDPDELIKKRSLKK